LQVFQRLKPIFEPIFAIGQAPEANKINKLDVIPNDRGNIEHQRQETKFMFCPGCGLEERQSNQFCRACGTDLRSIRFALEAPDKITASAITARDEIGSAVAAKIRETSLSEFQEVAEDLLPEIEKFLESPEEKRLRRIRAGIVTSSIGLGATLAFAIAAALMKDSGIFMVAGAGLVCFFIGIGLVINGLFLTMPRKQLSDRSPDGNRQRELDKHPLNIKTNDLVLPEGTPHSFSSVTENTTRHLEEKQPVKR
jgi:hypothetical protein